MSKAEQTKRNRAPAHKAGKNKTGKTNDMSAEELAKVSGGSGGAWRVGKPYLEDYSTGWVQDRRRPRD